jgi:multidrug efflux pump subunit AcrA (membrane-fusion protein)
MSSESRNPPDAREVVPTEAGNGNAPSLSLTETPPSPGDPAAKVFRSDFLREHRLRKDVGDLVRVTPSWVGPAFWLVITFAFAGLAYGVLGRVHEYAVGQAVVRFSDRADLTALSNGTVIGVAVHSGESVSIGQTLVRFYSGEESAEFERVEREFELQLVTLLRDPLDQDARQSMARLRSERDRIRLRLGEKALRSPIEGTVSDIRIRQGQLLTAGDPVMKIVGRTPKLMLIVALPGEYRPLLRPGLPLKLQLKGYPYSHENLRVSAIGDEIVGPGAVRRFLGTEIGDAFPIDGPSVLVYAELSPGGFTWEGRRRPFYDGMLGRADVAVRSQSTILALIPGLRAWTERWHD